MKLRSETGENRRDAGERELNHEGAKSAKERVENDLLLPIFVSFAPSRFNSLPVVLPGLSEVR